MLLGSEHAENSHQLTEIINGVYKIFKVAPVHDGGDIDSAASRKVALAKNTAMSSKNGFDVAIGLPRFIMTVEGLYPDPHYKREKLSRFLFLITAVIILIFCNITQTIMVLEVWGDLNEVIEVMTTMNMPIGMAFVKFLGVRYHADVLRQLLLTMTNDWNSPKTKEQFELMWKNAKTSRLISATQISFAELTCIFYVTAIMIYSHSDKKEWALLETNETLPRKLFFKGEFFYDWQKSPQYQVTWALQCASMVLAGSAYSAIDAFFAVLVLHLCSRLNIMRNKIKTLVMSLTDKWDGDSYNKILSELVEDHVFLEGYAKSIEDAFNLQFLVQMMVCTVVICLQGYEIVMIATKGVGLSIFELLYMLYFILSFMFSIFIYCYVSERLREECEEIGDAIYEMDWYTLPVNIATPLMMIMMRAKKPFPLTAGKFVEFSMELYASILKTSGGYLSMLLAVKDRLD